jgi:serine/threonine-protein kinase
VGFDLERLAVTTNPEPMVEGVVTKESGAADFDVARDGTLVYVPGIGVDLSRRLVFVSRSGQQTPVPGLDSGNYRSVRINPQGTQIAFETAQSEGNLWTYDVARAARNPLTTGPADDRSPLWHPTEKRVVFGSTRDGRTGLFVVNSDGTGPVEPLMNDDKATELWPSSWSRDGRTLLFSANVLGLANIGEFSFADKKIDSRLSTAEFNEAFPMLSPDDLWVAYASQRAGQTQVYIERHPGLGDRRPISSGGGTQPLWSRNGRELYYFDTFNQQLMMVPITPGPNLVVGTQKALFPAALFQLRGWRTYDVMPDGRFVMILRSGSDAGTRANPIVVQNWTEELKARVPVK